MCVCVCVCVRESIYMYIYIYIYSHMFRQLHIVIQFSNNYGKNSFIRYDHMPVDIYTIYSCKTNNCVS